MRDEAILDLFFARSEEAIDALRQTYGAACLRLAENILKNPADAEECVDDAYLAAWNAIPPQRPESLGAWLLRVVRNQALRRYRANTAQKRNSFFDAALDELADIVPSPSGAEERLDERELTALLDRFLDSLDPASRVIFVRRYWYAEPMEDIARAMGMPRSTVSVRLHRTRNKLRDCLIKEGYDL